MRRQFISHAISAAALLTLSAPSASAADNAVVEEKAAVCSGCHGENGISQTENIPSHAASRINSCKGSSCSSAPARARTSRCSPAVARYLACFK
ncbi:cytochrome c553 [Bradyrhizobium sp. USDA 4449]